MADGIVAWVWLVVGYSYLLSAKNSEKVATATGYFRNFGYAKL
jgi:hypothetical protein